MLLLLLLISTGCDVNIPGCGKRSLPFFKKIVPPSLPNPIASTPGAPVTTATNPLTAVAPIATKPAGKSPLLDSSIEMSVTKAKPTATASATPTATPQEVEKIAFTTIEKDKPTLWTMNTDGTNRVRLTKVGTSSWFPLWSPNGKLLAFLSDMNDGKINLFVMKKGELTFQQITSYEDMSVGNSTNLKPPFSWSPKSDEIVYCYRNQIWKMNLDTLTPESISTQDPSYVISAIEWAPHRDTKYVAFLVKKGDRFFSLKLANPRLKDELKLDESSVPLSDISWTSEARDVAYISDSSKIFTASAETSLPKTIINAASPQLGPMLCYSPAESGSVLMVLAKKAIDEPLYRVAIVDKTAKDAQDPGSLKYLTEPSVVFATWSPDGSKIAYVQNGELWVMDSNNGANKLRIAAIGVQSPSWSKK